MEIEFPKSECLLCNSNYTTRGIGKHIRVCLENKLNNIEGKKATYYLIHVYPDYAKEYFLYLLVKENMKLKDLDKFLRDIWVDCCGHMSGFFDKNFNEISNKESIGKISHYMDTVVYQYDFGDTTELQVKILEEYDVPSSFKGKIVLLARNAAPIIPCDECGERPAVEICQECQWNGDGGWLCEQCIEEHSCDDDMFLPVCNSPRTGICGYCEEGSEIDNDKILNKFLKQL